MIGYIIGSFFIGLGFLVAKYPMLLAGYNTMSKKEREKIDIKGVTRIVRTVFIGMGICMIIASFILDKTGNMSIMDVVFPVILFGGIGIMFIAQRKYTKEATPSKMNKYGSIGVIIFIFVLLGYIVYAAASDEVIIHADKVEVTGHYGVTIPIESINKVEYQKFLPDIGFRSNGISFWKYHKGKFYSDDLGEVRLFLHSNKGPYLIIYSEGNPPVIINRKNTEELLGLYQALEEKRKNVIP